jgi:hypothetical protein
MGAEGSRSIDELGCPGSLEVHHAVLAFVVGKDPYQAAVTAWMRVHLMGDTGIRNMFYGTSCQLCQNTQVKVQRKNMDQ